MAEIQTSHLVIDGVRCLVRASGPQTEHEAIVFLHGNPGSSEDWSDLMREAGDFGRAIAPDMPAYGKSERPRSFEYSVSGYARFLDGILSALGIDRVHLVLHDFGGPWGMQWAADHPSRIASLTLINVGVVPGFRWHRLAKIWRTPVVGELFQAAATRGAFKALLNGENPKPFPDAFLNRMFDDADWGLKRAVLALYRATPDLSTLSQQQAAVLKPLGLPALVLWGDSDPYVPVKFAEVQQQYFKADTHILHGAGHWPMVDEPERVRDLMIPFLRKQMQGPTQSAMRGASA
jgi:pimeloyl-ACP methyl ester carboxylesterase